MATNRSASFWDQEMEKNMPSVAEGDVDPCVVWAIDRIIGSLGESKDDVRDLRKQMLARWKGAALSVAKNPSNVGVFFAMAQNSGDVFGFGEGKITASNVQPLLERADSLFVYSGGKRFGPLAGFDIGLILICFFLFIVLAAAAIVLLSHG